MALSELSSEKPVFYDLTSDLVLPENVLAMRQTNSIVFTTCSEE